ncbi:hypothetical protein V1260_11720 [Brachybacterium sp. J144]|uniref:hypothetical protein n=1 Tax=Brachybacterium sp. J144 TaxID=3116487 RepID=UPI002E765028|nr:hypothetical protein [Brachybacterium sp. J144]MEE1651449.1 hypothetical protein [Brachybacterium sp. J144]
MTRPTRRLGSLTVSALGYGAMPVSHGRGQGGAEPSWRCVDGESIQITGGGWGRGGLTILPLEIRAEA